MNNRFAASSVAAAAVFRSLLSFLFPICEQNVRKAQLRVGQYNVWTHCLALGLPFPIICFLLWKNEKLRTIEWIENTQRDARNWTVTETGSKIIFQNVLLLQLGPRSLFRRHMAAILHIIGYRLPQVVAMSGLRTWAYLLWLGRAEQIFVVSWHQSFSVIAPENLSSLDTLIHGNCTVFLQSQSAVPGRGFKTALQRHSLTGECAVCRSEATGVSVNHMVRRGERTNFEERDKFEETFNVGNWLSAVRFSILQFFHKLSPFLFYSQARCDPGMVSVLQIGPTVRPGSFREVYFGHRFFCAAR